jgi:biotin carboxyl carrier protein
MLYDVNINGKNYRLELNPVDGRWSYRVDSKAVEVDAVPIRPNVLSLRIGNTAYEVRSERIANDWYLWVGNTRFAAEVRDPRSLRGRSRAQEERGSRKIVAPMPGKVVRVLVREGDEVELGAGMAVVEAMKMQNEIKSPKKGKVQKVLVSEGTAVNAADVLAIVE